MPDDLIAQMSGVNVLSHWGKLYPPWINPHRCCRVAGTQVASVGNFSQLQLFSQDPRMIVVFAFSFVQPANGTINVFDTGGAISGTVSGNPAAVVEGDTPPGVNMFQATPAAAPQVNWTIGVGANFSNTWLPPWAFAVIQKGNGLTFTTNAVNQNLSGSVMCAAIEPDELLIQIR